jgi:hypothetical protein
MATNGVINQNRRRMKIHETTKFCYPTKESIDAWRSKLESITGLYAINLRALDKDSDMQELWKAMEIDKMFYESLANDILCAL